MGGGAGARFGNRKMRVKDRDAVRRGRGIGERVQRCVDRGRQRKVGGTGSGRGVQRIQIVNNRVVEGTTEGKGRRNGRQGVIKNPTGGGDGVIEVGGAGRARADGPGRGSGPGLESLKEWR